MGVAAALALLLALVRAFFRRCQRRRAWRTELAAHTPTGARSGSQSELGGLAKVELPGAPPPEKDLDEPSGGSRGGRTPSPDSALRSPLLPPPPPPPLVINKAKSGCPASELNAGAECRPRTESPQVEALAGEEPPPPPPKD